MRFAPDDHLLALTLHHIAFDGWSMGHLMHELTALYAAFRRGEPSPLPPPALQYREYAAWQRRYLAGGALDRQLSHWRQALADLPSLSLPTDRLRPSTPSSRGGHVRVSVPPGVTERLRAVGRDASASLFMVLLAGFQALLHRCTGQEDFAVGSPIAGRGRAELEGLIGFFVNTLVLRADARGDPAFRDLLARARSTCLDAYAHQDVPFEKLVNDLAPQRDYSRTPLFQVMFHLQNASVGSFAFDGIEVDLLTSDIPSAKFDLSVNVVESGAGLECLVEYATDLFTEETAARFAQRFQMVLEAVAQDPDQRLSDIPLLSAAEERALRDGHGFQAAGFPADRCIHELIEARAAATPEAVAVQAAGAALTYGELEHAANRLARRLRAHGAGRGSLVGVLLDRDVGLSAGFLGVLKAGAAVVPLDPTLPEERLRLLAQDAGLRLVVAKAAAAATAKGLGLGLVPIEEAFAEGDGTPVGRLAEPSDPAYVMYTSGSTGTPKGVVVRHAGFMNSTTVGRQAYPHPCGRYALTSSIGFEASLPPLLWALADGGTTVLPPEEAQRDPALLAATVRGAGVTDLMITPSHYRLLLEAGGAAALASLRQVTLVGEAWTGELVRLHHATVPQATLLNAYGPTETTMYCTIEALPLAAASRPRATLGRAIPNLRLTVLDPRGRPVPIGLVGELHIGGVGVTGAYLNRPELSRERFVPDPWPRPPLPGELHPGLCYRSGDLVRPLADGNLEFLGRADFQVKIRGHRVEPGEVEAGLARHPRVREAAVTAHGEGAGKRLVAYLALSDGVPVPPGELRAFLRRFLPEHMVPSQFVTLPALPLNANGKVDRKRLPDPPRERPELQQDFVAPRDALEERLAAIWGGVLRLDRVGVHDNFFEVGGDSLSTVQVATRAQQAGLPLQLRHLFEHQTVAELASALRGSVGDDPVAGPAAQGIQGRRGAGLLAFNTQGKRRALFLVHPAGGTVGHFVALAHALGPAQPLYAVQAAGLEDDTPPHDSIAAMAEHYLALLRTVQPRGPYLLGGFSVGSFVALEMARRLRERGEGVALLALLDPPLRQAAAVDEKAVERLASRIEALAPVAGRPAAAEARRIAAERLELSQVLNLPLDTLQDALPPEVLARHMRVLGAHVRASLRHRFVPCPGDALVLVSEETLRALPRFRDEVRPLVGGAVEIATIPGGHFTMLAPPNVAHLSERLAGALAKATGPAAD
ncbi:MAG: amino acid adenylation domain-containing protein [Halobacteriales archaeon]|nr:amino acid adenylation domain-containing protein [Halobacteriales archaeon]